MHLFDFQSSLIKAIDVPGLTLGELVRRTAESLRELGLADGVLLVTRDADNSMRPTAHGIGHAVVRDWLSAATCDMSFIEALANPPGHLVSRHQDRDQTVHLMTTQLYFADQSCNVVFYRADSAYAQTAVSHLCYAAMKLVDHLGKCIKKEAISRLTGTDRETYNALRQANMEAKGAAQLLGISIATLYARERRLRTTLHRLGGEPIKTRTAMVSLLTRDL